MLEEASTKLNNVNSGFDQSPIQDNINFFTTSTTKLILMSLSTFGIYELYWFYKNWVSIKNTGKKCRPFWRALFSHFFAYSCFNHIRDAMSRNKVDEIFPSGFLAIAYFILVVLWRLPDPYALISILSFAPIIIANKAALAVNKAQFPDFVNNERYSKWNLLTILLGGILVILAI